MKNTLFASLGVVLLCSFCFVLGKKISPPSICFEGLHEGKHIIAGMDFPLHIIASQTGPVLREQVSAKGDYYENYALDDTTLLLANVTIEGDSGDFRIHVDKECKVEVQVKTNTGIAKKSFYAVSSPVIPSFGRFHGQCQSSVTNFLDQKKGVVAYMHGYGLNGMCEVDGYSIVRITTDDQVERVTNKGAKINDANISLIEAATPGDIYWFRNIRYRCPGASGPQLGNDISIEIE
ncbi:MAG: hypothetical protein IT258_16395 [Saprospiraceae bacterium]|nr:hypothetical protein [Saprospiraceae bacterium]